MSYSHWMSKQGQIQGFQKLNLYSGTRKAGSYGQQLQPEVGDEDLKLAQICACDELHQKGESS